MVSAGLRLLLADGNDDGRGGSDCIVKLLDSWSVSTGTRHTTSSRATVVICVDWDRSKCQLEEDADVLSLSVTRLGNKQLKISSTWVAAR